MSGSETEIEETTEEWTREVSIMKKKKRIQLPSKVCISISI